MDNRPGIEGRKFTIKLSKDSFQNKNILGYDFEDEFPNFEDRKKLKEIWKDLYPKIDPKYGVVILTGTTADLIPKHNNGYEDMFNKPNNYKFIPFNKLNDDNKM